MKTTLLLKRSYKENSTWQTSDMGHWIWTWEMKLWGTIRIKIFAWWRKVFRPYGQLNADLSTMMTKRSLRSCTRILKHTKKGWKAERATDECSHKKDGRWMRSSLHIVLQLDEVYRMDETLSAFNFRSSLMKTSIKKHTYTRCGRIGLLRATTG